MLRLAQNAWPGRALHVPRLSEVLRCCSNRASSSPAGMRASLAVARREHNVLSLPIRVSWPNKTNLFCARQSGAFPRFEAAGHRADVFVAHLLQSLGGERGIPKAFGTAVADSHCVGVGHLFFDVHDFTAREARA